MSKREHDTPPALDFSNAERNIRQTVLVECPHCHIRVDPSHKGGLCTQCGQNVNIVDGINPNRALLLMKPSARMPELCCECGIPTAEMDRVTTYDPDLAVSTALMAPSIFQPLVWLIDKLRNLAEPKTELPTFRIPLCGFCRDKRPTPVSVHPADDYYQCPVHIDFKRRYDELNHARNP